MKKLGVLILLTLVSCVTEEKVEYHWSAMELLREQHKDELTEWQELVLAIALTESRFEPKAIGKDQDYGILQITPIYVEELNRLGFDFSHEDAFDIGKSIEMFEAMQSVKNPNKDKDLAILYHNKSSGYAIRVKESLQMIKRYEAIRGKL